MYCRIHHENIGALLKCPKCEANRMSGVTERPKVETRLDGVGAARGNTQLAAGSNPANALEKESK